MHDATRSAFERALPAIDRVLEVLFYAAYALLIAVLLLEGAPAGDSAPINPLLLPRIVVPAAGLVFVSVLRRIINAPRPYETNAAEPLIRKETKGRSFPSKHAYSSFMIALCWWHVSLPASIFLLVAALATSAVRVAGGVHFARDVAAGAAIAFACTALMFLW